MVQSVRKKNQLGRVSSNFFYYQLDFSKDLEPVREGSIDPGVFILNPSTQAGPDLQHQY